LPCVTFTSRTPARALAACAAATAVLFAAPAAPSQPPPISKERLQWYLAGWLDGASPNGVRTAWLDCERVDDGFRCRARVVAPKLGAVACMSSRWTLYGRPIGGWKRETCGTPPPAPAPSS